LSKDYSNIKVEIQGMQLKLGEQFKNAKNEFSDRDYLMMIDEDFKQKQKALKTCKLFILSFNLLAKTKKTSVDNSRDKNGNLVNWECSRCSYFNEGRNTSTCNVCGENGRPS
jgi:hypothetical protein